MIQVEFRGKTLDNPRWVYGYFLFDGIGAFIIQNGVAGLPAEFIKVDPETVGRFSGFLDKHGKRIFEHDFVIGTQSFMRGDGYKGRKYPNTIKVLCQVVYGQEGFHHPEVIGPLPEFREAFEKYWYRNVGYLLHPLGEGYILHQQEGLPDLVGDGKTCYGIELDGNKHDNPQKLSYRLEGAFYR